MTIKTIQYWRKGLRSLLTITLAISSSFIAADLLAEEGSQQAINSQESYLKVSPERCVALREGQICYQNIVLDWQTVNKGNYCLFFKDNSRPLRCWSNLNQAQFKMDFQSKQSKRFVLKTKDSARGVASVEVSVAWVYGNKKRRRASWRLF